MSSEAVNGKEDQEPGVSAFERKIIRQLEYYFGDYNLGRDKFMNEQMQKDDGFIKLDVLLTFNRLKALTTDKQTLLDALAKSDSGLIEISEDKEKIRRFKSKPLPLPDRHHREELKSRTLYVKGFPLDTNIDQLLDFFEDVSSGEVDSVQMRRKLPPEERHFKGSVFAVFSRREHAQKFLDVKDLKFKDEHALIRMTKDSYWSKKNEERKAEKAKKKMEQEEAKKKNVATEAEQIKEKREAHAKNAILHIDGLSPDATREDIKDVFEDFAKIGWVEFSKGDAEGYIRFIDDEGAEKAWREASDAGGGVVRVCGSEVKGEVLTGEAEEKHWEHIFKEQAERRQMKRQGRDKKSAKRGRGRGRGRKRSADSAGAADDTPTEQASPGKGGMQKSPTRKAKHVIFDDTVTTHKPVTRHDDEVSENVHYASDSEDYAKTEVRKKRPAEDSDEPPRKRRRAYSMGDKN